MYIFTTFCGPAKLNLMLGVLLLLYIIIKQKDMTKMDIFWFWFKVIIIIVMSFSINRMCTLGYSAIAWFVATIPYGIYVLVMSI